VPPMLRPGEPGNALPAEPHQTSRAGPVVRLAAREVYADPALPFALLTVASLIGLLAWHTWLTWFSVAAIAGYSLSGST
jgi:hypothetical protein